MAIPKRTTTSLSHRLASRSKRINRTQARRRRQATAILDHFLNTISKPIPTADPSLEVLSRSQRLRVADLAVITGIEPQVWIQRAVDSFLECEAPVYAGKARRAS